MMSTYLEKDLHSVYVDNELPSAYLEAYESLVAADERHAAAQRKVQSLHAAFQQDATEREIDQTFLDASFVRLQTKLQYHKHAIAPQESKSPIRQLAQWGVPLAAAAVFALVIIPILHPANGKNDAINAIASTKLTPIAENDIAVDGTFDQKTLSAIAVNGGTAAQGAMTVSTGGVPGADPHRLRRKRLHDRLTSIDVFRPASANADNGLSIRISISPMHDVQDEEIIIPLPNIATTQQ